MKTTKDTLLVVFVSFISIARLARCGVTSVLDDRDRETEAIEKLVRKEVFSSLQFLNEDEASSRYYQISNQNPNNKLQTGNSYKTPEYGYYSGTSKPNDQSSSRYGKANGNLNSPVDYEYKTPNQEVRIDGISNAARSNNVTPYSAVSSMNTREPDGYTITLPSLGGGRLFYGGGGGGAAAAAAGGGGGGEYGISGLYNGIGEVASRLRPDNVIRRKMRRVGRLVGYGGGNGGGNRFEYGIGSGGLTGLQGMNLGFGGGSGSGGVGSGGYYTGYSDGGVDLNVGNGRKAYYGNAGYGLQGGSGSGRSWTIGGGNGATPADYYNSRYGYPGSSNTVSASVDGTSGGGGSRRYAVSYPNDAPSTTVSTADEEAPPQYELMFLRNQPNSSNLRIQNGSNADSDVRIASSGSASDTNRDTANGPVYRVNTSSSGTISTPGGGVDEYRVVVVNNDSPGSGSARNRISLSSNSPQGGSGSGSSWSLSSSGTSGSGGSGGRAGQGGFQITTPITSTQVSIPPTSIVGSVLSTVQGAATGEQTRSLGTSNEPPAGKFIQVIPVKKSS